MSETRTAAGRALLDVIEAATGWAAAEIDRDFGPLVADVEQEAADHRRPLRRGQGMKGYIEPQWKGSTIRADWTCPKCLERGDVDADYPGNWTIRCESCGQWFALSPWIEIVAVDNKYGAADGTSAYQVSEATFPRPSAQTPATPEGE